MYLNTVFKYNVFKYCPALTSIILIFQLYTSSGNAGTEQFDLSSFMLN